MRKFNLFLYFFIIFIGGWVWIVPIDAQDQCSVVDGVEYPIDTNQFVLVQDFAIASPRHQGRYHTGEDWFYARGQFPGKSLDQPVRAIANGLVVLSGVNAWGVDGGVIIVRHRMPNGSYFFSQYGHLAQTDTIRFPQRLTCVTQGQVLAVIGDSRPAPHLHLEIRVFVPGMEGSPGDNPGPGYTREHPYDLGYRRPMEYITNLQAQFTQAHAWQFVGRAQGEQPAPLLLNDNSMLHIDDNIMRRLTWDGRALWRVEQTRNPIFLFGYQANSYLVTDDGGVHQINLENGAYTRSWNLGVNPVTAPIRIAGGWLYIGTSGGLFAVSDDHQDMLWRKEAMPAFIHGIATASLLALQTADNRLWTLSSDGDVLHQADLRAGVRFGGGAGGAVIAYTWGGLWQISPRAEWSLLSPDAPQGGANRGLMVDADGRIFITTDALLQIYSPMGERLSQVSLPQTLEGYTTITRYDDVLFIASSGGVLLAMREDGLVCGQLRVAGDTNAQSLWSQMGTDGILRLRLGRLMLGIRWSQFTRGC